MTYYVGIDQSYRNTGIVILNGKGDIIKHEVVQTLKDDGDYFDRSKMIAESVASSIKSTFDHSDEIWINIGIEGLAFGMRGTTLQQLAGLQFMIVNELRSQGFKPEVYTPSTVKKIATGSGKATKDDMWKSLPDTVKRKFEQVTKANGREDLCDAYWIAIKTKEEV